MWLCCNVSGGNPDNLFKIPGVGVSMYLLMLLFDVFCQTILNLTLKIRNKLLFYKISPKEIFYWSINSNVYFIDNQFDTVL